MPNYKEKLNTIIKYKYLLLNYIDSHMISIFLPLLFLYFCINTMVSILASQGANQLDAEFYSSNALFEPIITISLNFIAIYPIILIFLIIIAYVIKPELKPKIYNFTQKFSFRSLPLILFAVMNTTVCVLAILGASTLPIMNNPLTTSICSIIIQIVSFTPLILAILFVISVFLSIFEQ